MNNPDSNMTGLAKDTIISGMLGGAAMCARMLLCDEKMSVAWVIRRGAAAMITAALVGLFAQDYITSKGALYAAIGAAGAVAPEIMEYLIRYVRARGEKSISHVKQTTPKRRRKK